MTPQFYAEENPSSGHLGEAGALAPTNPFFTSAFVDSMAALGYRPWLMSLRNGNRLISAAVGLMKSGRLNRSLEFTSLPIGEVSDLFWDKALHFCRDRRVSYLEVNSFASTPHRIPALTGEFERRARREYIIDLRKPTLWARLSSNHKRNVKLARKAGLQVRVRSDADACLEHVRLVQSSLERRKARGEKVDESGEVEAFLTYARHGLAEWFQAVKGGEVLSSLLIFKAERGAYYQSAGTSPEGMAHGASSFLICETAAALRDRGMDVFNLGGADEHNPGLQRFKAGFDTASVDLQAIRLYLGSALKRRLTTAAALLRSDPRAFVGQLAGHWERYVVYAAAPADVVPADPIEGVSVEELSRESAAALPREDADVRRQMERFEALGFKGAYVVRCSGRVAHLAALVTAELDAHLPVRNVRLAPGEAEITHCLTLPDFRGQGIYPFAIRALCRVAAERGVHRVFMITAAANHASQHGIEKAGFRRRGTIVGVVLPFWPGGTRFTFRGHRWAGNG